MAGRTRRRFLAHSGATVAALSTLHRRVDAAQNTIVLGIIGCGGQGTHLARAFAQRQDVSLAYVCDPDLNRVKSAAEAVAAITKKTPTAVQDLRRVLDDTSVDAVVIATPDHWHAPAAILACAAGKHVYVEKPCAHNIREGRLMVDAARRANRVMQVGTQGRSTPHVAEAMQRLREGAIGTVLVAKAWNSQRRDNIGRGRVAKPPAGLDYDLWLGPAPETPYHTNYLHYKWHWWYAFGTGDIGNDGVHNIDLARWGLGVDTHPATVVASGVKLFFDDDQQFPDTHHVVFDFPGDGTVGGRRQLVYEQRIWSPYAMEGVENGNAFYGTEGYLILHPGRGWQLYGRDNKLKETGKPSPVGGPHYQNFVDAIRNGQRPNADIEIGHRSAALCHLGNIAARIGRVVHFDAAAERIVGDDEADRWVKREYRSGGHWAIPAGV